jgi:hypothetical protein
MVKVIVNEEVYVECAKCGYYRKPTSYGKNRRRKSCDNCKGNK